MSLKRILIALSIILACTSVASTYGLYGHQNNNSISTWNNSFSSGYYGKTHEVKPYTKKDGTYIRGHRSGNPNSGVHWRNNICY